MFILMLSSFFKIIHQIFAPSLHKPQSSRIQIQIQVPDNLDPKNNSLGTFQTTELGFKRNILEMNICAV